MSWRYEHDLRLAASFLRSVETDKPRANLELRELAAQIEQIADSYAKARPDGAVRWRGRTNRPAAG